MSADIIAFAKRGAPPADGNGAREALIRIFEEHGCDEPGDPAAVESADVVLMKLWDAGFKVVPVTE